jgi:hypothetical protein
MFRIGRKLLGSLQQNMEANFTLLIMGDELWFYVENRRRNQSIVWSDEGETKPFRKISDKKAMLTILWDPATFYIVGGSADRHGNQIGPMCSIGGRTSRKLDCGRRRAFYFLSYQGNLQVTRGFVHVSDGWLFARMRF